MISSVIENEIITKLPFLINSFGSVNKILTYLKEVNSVSLGIPKKDLLNFSYINLIFSTKGFVKSQNSFNQIAKISKPFRAKTCTKVEEYIGERT